MSKNSKSRPHPCIQTGSIEFSLTMPVVSELGQLKHRTAIFATSGQLLRNRLENDHDLLRSRQALRMLQVQHTLGQQAAVAYGR
jgi:hypothetical protein